MRQDILELRQYTLRPGARDTLIELFDRAFVEPQEACGMSAAEIKRDPEWQAATNSFAGLLQHVELRRLTPTSRSQLH